MDARPVETGAAAAGGSAWRRINLRKLAIRFAIELGPPLVFVISLQATDLVPATALFIVAVALTALYSWFEKRHFPYIPAGMLLLVGALGGLTMWQGEASYIQVNATVVNGGAALAILIGLGTGRLLLKRALEDGFRLTEDAWRRLSIRMAVYLTCLALLNEVVRHSASVETWAWFKAAIPLLNALFLAANWPLIRSHLSGK